MWNKNFIENVSYFDVAFYWIYLYFLKIDFEGFENVEWAGGRTQLGFCLASIGLMVKFTKFIKNLKKNFVEENLKVILITNIFECFQFFGWFQAFLKILLLYSSSVRYYLNHRYHEIWNY